MSCLEELLEAGFYDAVAALLERRGTPEAAVRLARVARSVLDLDAEDFATLAQVTDRAWGARLRRASFPLLLHDPERGALGSLVPLYELMLEVLDLRARRGEPLQVVVSAHLIGEYLRLLAWEQRLGHAGDPLRIGDDVGERWGTADPTCSHNAALRSTARRALHVAGGDQAGYTGWLDKFHSRLGDALAVCGMNHRVVDPGRRPDAGQGCERPCSWALAGSQAERLALDARCRLASLYVDSPIVELRHHAPVGHFFGVPSQAEVDDAWQRTWDRLAAPWPDGGNPLPEGPPSGLPGEALPGMAQLVSAIAGVTVRPSAILPDIADELRETLG